MNELSKLSGLIFTGDSYEMLSAEREVELIRGVQAGDSDAFTELAKGYSRALRSFLKGFSNTEALSLSDAREELLIAFSEQVMIYDLRSCEKRLSYYLKHPCKARINQVRDEAAMPVSIPTVQMKRLRKLTRENQGEPSEMMKHASAAGLSAQTLLHLMQWKHTASLDVDSTGEDLPEEQEQTRTADLSEYADIALAAISDDPTASLVVNYRYYFDDPSESYLARHPRSNQLVADRVGISPTKVSRVHAAALETMRGALGIGTTQGEEAA